MGQLAITPPKWKNKLCHDIFLVSSTAIFSFGWVSTAHADYLGTDNLRIFPGAIDDITDGYDIGDRIEFIVEVTPRDTGSESGNAAWSTFYIPSSTKVVGARYLTLDGMGNYVTAAADDVDSTYDGWGSRGAAGYGAGG